MANFERMASPRLFNVLLSLIAPVAMSNLPLILPGGSPSLSKCSHGHVETPSSSLFSLLFFPGMRKSSLPARTHEHTTLSLFIQFRSAQHNVMSMEKSTQRGPTRETFRCPHQRSLHVGSRTSVMSGASLLHPRRLGLGDVLVVGLVLQLSAEVLDGFIQSLLQRYLAKQREHSLNLYCED